MHVRQRSTRALTAAVQHHATAAISQARERVAQSSHRLEAVHVGERLAFERREAHDHEVGESSLLVTAAPAAEHDHQLVVDGFRRVLVSLEHLGVGLRRCSAPTNGLVVIGFLEWLLHLTSSKWWRRLI